MAWRVLPLALMPISSKSDLLFSPRGIEPPAVALLHSRKVRDAIAFWGLAGFVAVVYTVPGEWIEGARELRLALVMASVAAALMVFTRLGGARPFSLDGVRGLALLGLVLWAAISTSWSVNPFVTAGTAVELFKLAAVYLTMVNVIHNWERLRTIAVVVVLASIVTSAGVLNWYHSGVDLVEGYRARWVGMYADPNHMAMGLALVAPIALTLALRRRSGWLLRVVALAAMALAVSAVVVAHSRGAFIGLCVGFLFWMARQERRLKAIAVGALCLGATWVFAPASFWQRNQTVASFREDVSAMGRVHAWEAAAKMNIDRPLVGVGAGAFRYAWPTYARPEAKRAYVAHNVFLDVLGELGIPGFLLFLVFAGGAAAGGFFGSCDRDGGWLAVAVSSATVGYLVSDVSSGFLLSPHLFLLLAMSACCERLAADSRPVWGRLAPAQALA